MRLCLLTCVLAAARGRGWPTLPVDLGADAVSGCSCRAAADRALVVCFGGYRCTRFPVVTTRSDTLRVRTTMIEEIGAGDLNRYSYLRALDIESNHQLRSIQPGAFAQLARLERLSISFCSSLVHVHESLFVGLTSLRNLTLAGTGLTALGGVARALRPAALPALDALDLSENAFEAVPEDALRPMAGSPLSRLDLSLCQLERVHAAALDPLRALRHLDVSENDLNATTVESLLLGLTAAGVNLTSLDLSALSLRKRPPRALLRAVARAGVRRLRLARNQFETILDDDFPPMRRLEELDLRRVSAVHVGPRAFEPRRFPRLRVLLLGGNYLAGVHQGHASPQLETLDLSHNSVGNQNLMYFEMTSDTFRDFRHLLSLDLSFNRIKALYDYTFRGLERLETLLMENGTVFHIGPGTFRCTPRLGTLGLAANPLTANGDLSRRQFEGLGALRTLDLSRCGIRRLDERDNVFEETPNVTRLLLRGNRLCALRAGLLRPLRRLRLLDLRDNRLVASDGALLPPGGARPRSLLLANNKLTQLTPALLADVALLLRADAASEVDLDGNIFACDCGSMYAAYAWLEANGSAALRGWLARGAGRCASPELWQERRVAEYLAQVRGAQCLLYGGVSGLALLAWSTPAVALLAALALAAALGLKFRVYLGYWLFRAKLALGRRLAGAAGAAAAGGAGAAGARRYDAFVSYCTADRGFVLDMVAQLEGRPPHLKLCVAERDFEAGAFISEAVLSGISESRYVILNVSDSFARSQWCRWEAQLAECRRLGPRGAAHDPLILVRIGSVDAKHLTATLKFLMKTKIFLTWDENNPEQFWNKLRSILTRN